MSGTNSRSQRCGGLRRCLTVFVIFSFYGANADTADQFDACHLFKTETEFVTQTLYMAMEGVRHTLTIPTVYFEDRFDRVNGSEHRAQLFRMMIDDFTPVTRRESAELLREGRKDYFNFVLHDPIDLEQSLPIVAESMMTGDGRDMTVYAVADSGNSLTQILPINDVQTRRDVFVAGQLADGTGAIISCSKPHNSLNQRCNHDFRAHGIDVRMGYSREYLPEWGGLQSYVSDFISCSLTH